MASSFFRWIYNVFASFIGEIFRKLFRSHHVKEFDCKMMDTSEDDEIETISSSSSRGCDGFASFRGEDVRKSFVSHHVKELDSKMMDTSEDDEIKTISSSSSGGYDGFASRKSFVIHHVKEFDRKMMDTSEDDEIETISSSSSGGYDGFASRKSFVSHHVKEFDRKMMDTSKDDGIEINSSSSSRSYDVFVSFRGEDVRKSLLSHLLSALARKAINTFKDHGIERSLQIAPELVSAIKESRIAIVIFSKNYASSTWCLDELVKIHECSKKLDQMVIPVFYHVDPSDVRKQTGEFGKVFGVTCKGKTEDQKHRWMIALSDVANLAGEDLQNCPDEAAMIEKIAIDVFKKLITPTDDFGGFVGIKAHLEALNSMLCLKSEEARMVGILGTSGIGKTTIARALFSQHSSKFDNCAFITYKRTIRNDYEMKLCWEEKFLSEILGPMDLKIYDFGMVKRRLQHKKVLIVLDDVDDLELLKTLVGQTGWFGSGSRIIVITQDRHLLKAHKIDLLYEVELPSKALALKMFCRSAFDQDSPLDGFMELSVRMVKIAGNLPLGLSVLGSSLNGRGKKEWMEMLPKLENGLNENLLKIFRVSYDRLDEECQKLFLYIAFACIIFNGVQVSYIEDLLEDRLSVSLSVLAEKSFIRITSPYETIEVHNLLQKLAREIVHAESTDNPGKRRFLVDAKDICNVFTDNNGTETLLGIYFDTSDINEPFSVNEKSFQGMLNLQFLIVCDYGCWGRNNTEGRLYLPQGLVYLPRKLRLLIWNNFPLECLPCNFKAEFLVELSMEDSKLEKLWEGTAKLGSLKKINMRNSRYLIEIPDLSTAKNLEKLYLFGCKSLLTLPSSIKYVNNLRRLNLGECIKLERFPTHVNLKSLEYLNLRGCIRMRNFPQISVYNPTGFFYSELESTIRYREQVSSSSPSPIYDVFPNFHEPDVRKGLLSHLHKELGSKSITTFIDRGIQRSETMGPSLISAIRNSRFSIVIFSKSYASSSWCLDELVEIHASYKKLDQLIIPVFYDVDPSEVRKQTRGFGKVFKKTCKGKPDYQKQRWMQALTDVANITVEISGKGCAGPDMIGKIADFISKKVLTSSNFDDEWVRLEAHKGNEFNIKKGGR